MYQYITTCFLLNHPQPSSLSGHPLAKNQQSLGAEIDEMFEREAVTSGPKGRREEPVPSDGCRD